MLVAYYKFPLLCQHLYVAVKIKEAVRKCGYRFKEKKNSDMGRPENAFTEQPPIKT